MVTESSHLLCKATIVISESQKHLVAIDYLHRIAMWVGEHVCQRNRAGTSIVINFPRSFVMKAFYLLSADIWGVYLATRVRGINSYEHPENHHQYFVTEGSDNACDLIQHLRKGTENHGCIDFNTISGRERTSS